MTTRRSRGPRCAALAAALGAALTVPVDAQHGESPGGGMEEFEEVDPYTKGDPERMERLGYRSFGPFQWYERDFTNHVNEAMGSIPMLWVETEHFKIGSTLGTYEIPNDREERDRLADELKRLKKRLGRLRPPRGELDPWLRLHLYAQRAEELYAMFARDFGVGADDFAADESGPYLGNEQKFQLLLCERKSEFRRFVSTYFQKRDYDTFRWGRADGMFFGTSIESIRDGWPDPDEEPFDAMLHCRMANGLATCFVDGFRSPFAAPGWLGIALGHVYVRRIDPRWVQAAGETEAQVRGEDDWRWEPRVHGLVQNDFFAATEDMFRWSGYADMNTRDHMVAWSKLDYLLGEAEGDRHGWLWALTSRPRQNEESPEARLEALAQLQREALLAYFELTPEALDEAWSRWVERRYDRR